MYTPKKIYKNDYPALLQQITQLPLFMYVQGELPPDTSIYLCVIGARHHSSYGEDACKHLIQGLAGYPIVIVSGLAIGIDSIAHEAALEAGLSTVAFPGSGLSPAVLYPRSKQYLAEQILEAGGALVSPFDLMQTGSHWTFPTRNRLMAGMCHATLIIEGEEGSGTLLTARHALEFGRDVMIIPGSIFSTLSYGPHLLMRDGAYPVTNVQEVLDILGFQREVVVPVETSETQGLLFDTVDADMSPIQKSILETLFEPLSRDELIRRMGTDASAVNIALSELELKGVVEERGGTWKANRKGRVTD
ncbi:MAG: DNA-protecting protein DprA [Patescibacteria group bacterium]